MLFSDINLAQECESNCGSAMMECFKICGNNTECQSSCYRGNIICVDACPCHTGKAYNDRSQTFWAILGSLWYFVSEILFICTIKN